MQSLNRHLTVRAWGVRSLWQPWRRYQVVAEFGTMNRSTSKSSLKSSANRSTSFTNPGLSRPKEDPTQHPMPAHISFEDFLQADTNRDGRVTAAEWDNYVRSKQSADEDPLQRGVTIHVPVSPGILKEIIGSDGFGITINGLHYSLNLKPEGRTIDLIKNAQLELQRLSKEIEILEAKKAPLDAAAARHVRRVMSGLLGYLLFQAGVVAKLTFFSRFGWDIMEPITYFLTFGISLVGLIFFTRNRLEFSYPALAALVARRKAIKLYKQYNFDEDAYLLLKREQATIKQHLDSLVPAHRIFDLENKYQSEIKGANNG
jgi:hypothetical protein